MKHALLFFSLWFFLGSFAQAMDEEDIPPPPMPEYMEEAGYEPPNDFERDIASEEVVEEEQSTEDIRREFLQAGDDEDGMGRDVSEVDSTADIQEVDPVDEGPITEGDAESIDDTPEVFVEEMAKEEPPADVDPVAESAKEIEQAEMQAPNTNQIKEAYLNAGDDKVTEAPVAAVTPAEAEAVTAPVEEPVADKLADVEEQLEEREAQQEAALAGARKPANKKKFKSGMYKFSEKCTMYKEPRSLSEKAGSIRPGRKLWIDAHNDGWHKAYKKSGTVYISADCLD